MSACLADLHMKQINWEGQIYNPSDIGVHNLGEFISVKRFKEPKDGGFSLKEYLADK